MSSEQERDSVRERVSGALNRAQTKLDHLSRDPDDAAELEAGAKRYCEQMGEPNTGSADRPSGTA